MRELSGHFKKLVYLYSEKKCILSSLKVVDDLTKIRSKI